MLGARTDEAIACGFLVLAGLGCSFLALLMTGGDSFFADKSNWVYAPLVAGLVLTVAAIGSTALGHVAPSAVFIAGSALAYFGAIVYWFLIL